MNLLLLLSALLSALTGIGSSARVPDTAAISTSVVTAARAGRMSVSVAVRPTQLVPILPQVAMARDTAAPVVDTPPLYAGRLRE